MIIVLLIAALLALIHRNRVLAALTVASMLVLVPSAALAQGVDTANSVGEIRLSAFTVSLTLSAFIPIVTALTTKLRTSDKVKGLVTLAVNFITSSIVAWQVADGSAVFSKETLVTAILGFVVSTASYLGFYQDVGINAKLLPDKGI